MFRAFYEIAEDGELVATDFRLWVVDLEKQGAVGLDDERVFGTIGQGFNHEGAQEFRRVPEGCTTQDVIPQGSAVCWRQSVNRRSLRDDGKGWNS